MEECVDVYQNQRDDILKIARSIGEEVRSRATGGMTFEERPAKKRRTQKANGVCVSEMPMRATRSQKRMALHANQESEDQLIVDDSEDDGSEYVEEGADPIPVAPSAVPDDGLVACPVCNKRMKVEAVYPHLDQCVGEDQSPMQHDISTAKQKQSASVAYSVPSPAKARQRLGALNYTLLSEAALRKKLAEIGIPAHGSKSLMQRRHIEWMNLWNASCDSNHPKTKRELLRELDIWDRTQGRQIANAQGPSGVMAKDFDAAGWAKSNEDDFADLIKKARQKSQVSLSSGSKDRGIEKEGHRQPQNIETNPNLDHRSTRHAIIELTSPSKPPIEQQQQQSQSSQMNGVAA